MVRGWRTIVSVAAALFGECAAARAAHIHGAAFAPPLPSLRLDRPCGRLVPSAAPVAGVALWVSGGTGPRGVPVSRTLHCISPRASMPFATCCPASLLMFVICVAGVAVCCVCEQAGKAPLNSETLSIGVGGVALTALLINRCPAAHSLLHSRVLAPLPLSRTQPANALARWQPHSIAPAQAFHRRLGQRAGPHRHSGITFSRMCGPTNLLSTFPPRSALPETMTCCLGFRV